jgi:hypothetical protein
MAEKIKIVNGGKVDTAGWKKIGKSFLITIIAAAIGFIADLTGLVDFGNLNSIAIVVLPWVANTLKVWLLPYESKA